MVGKKLQKRLANVGKNVGPMSAQRRLDVGPTSAQRRPNVGDVGPPVKITLGQRCSADVDPTIPQWLAGRRIAIWDDSLRCQGHALLAGQTLVKRRYDSEFFIVSQAVTCSFCRLTRSKVAVGQRGKPVCERHIYLITAFTSQRLT